MKCWIMFTYDSNGHSEVRSIRPGDQLEEAIDDAEAWLLYRPNHDSPPDFRYSIYVGAEGIEVSIARHSQGRADRVKIKSYRVRSDR